MEEGTPLIIKLYHIPLLSIKFMVSIGANPITSIEDENKFSIGSKWLSIKRRKSYLK